MTDRFSLPCLISYPNEIQEVHSSLLGDNKLVELLAVYRPHGLTLCLLCAGVPYLLPVQYLLLIFLWSLVIKNQRCTSHPMNTCDHRAIGFTTFF